VSECTSANIFAVLGTRAVTPPLATSGCLPGVTRALLLQEVAVPGITFEEGTLMPSDLAQSDLCFVTSTTRDLLPIWEIDHKPMALDSALMTRLQQAFVSYRANHVAAHARHKEVLST